jgi:hypothetical protein
LRGFAQHDALALPGDPPVPPWCCFKYGS